MGGEGMRFSLQTREIICDSIESVTCAQHHDANISIPGCDKNMPGVVMAAARHNRPFIMIYGGTIMKGHSELLESSINISTCYEAQLPREKYLEMTTLDEKKRIEEDAYWESWDVEKENGVGCRCRCDTDIVDVEGKDGSCLAEWVDVAGGWAAP
ncbi:hypothetical protein BN1708_016591 [Verticillium longisporum]|uniref:Dihydroxy-acid/6-phosphogluconate dehydratase N-terminal domain-containing protein n=2 Tax=Verticillium longisporum TaxID=100787 RepID=A0A0G4MUK4_VERLO|nr:hypothetical protein BN1708_016591 [Verticillium longisporum]